MVAAWKLDPVYCGAIKVGLPQVSLAALSDLHGLLTACESRLLSANGNTATQEDHDGIAAIARPNIGTHPKTEICAAPPARPRSRRRPPSKRDSGSAPIGSKSSSPAAARSERRGNDGGRR
jgi:hypothetical protein